MRPDKSWAIVALTLVAAIAMVAVTLYSRPARADGGAPPPAYQVPPNPQAGVYPQVVPLRGGPSCLMTALQLGYQTGRREVAYAATEACMLFTGARGVQLPYGYYGPFVSPHWQPPGWAIPLPPAPGY